MKAVQDDVVWYEAWQDTPLNAPQNPSSELEAERTPGCHLKSRENRGVWPRYFGRLVSYDKAHDRVVVASKGPQHGDGKKTVWSGTLSQYHSMWKCD